LVEEKKVSKKKNEKKIEKILAVSYLLEHDPTQEDKAYLSKLVSKFTRGFKPDDFSQFRFFEFFNSQKKQKVIELLKTSTFSCLSQNKLISTQVFFF
jgi:hypothetical protein